MDRWLVMRVNFLLGTLALCLFPKNYYDTNLRKFYIKKQT
jgi:hypothetical protein